MLGFAAAAYTTLSTVDFAKMYPDITPVVCTPNTKVDSENGVFVTNIDFIVVHCNMVASGTSFINGTESQVLASFPYDACPWNLMVYEPKTIEYHNFANDSISDIVITITDQNQNLIDFNSQNITVAIEIIEV